MIVYVDDFKLAARAELHDDRWAAIEAVIDMGDETTDGRFLCCVRMSDTLLPRRKLVNCWRASRSATRARSDARPINGPILMRERGVGMKATCSTT